MNMNDLWIQYFTATWCVPCKTFGPVLEKVATELNFPIEKISIDVNPEKLPADVMGVPTIILFNYSREIARFSGAKTEEGLVNWLALAAAHG